MDYIFQLFNFYVPRCVICDLSFMGALKIFKEKEHKRWILERLDGSQSLDVKGVSHHSLPAGCDSFH